MLDLTAEEKGSITILTIHLHEILMFNATSLKPQIIKHCQTEGCQVILNLAEVDYIDSSGIWLVVAIHREITENDGQFYVTGVSETVMQSLEMTRVAERLNIHDSVDAVLHKIHLP